MPYIAQNHRDEVDTCLQNIADKILKIDGENPEGLLNYCFTKLLLRTIPDPHTRIRYKQLNKMVGILECCKQELYRRAGSACENTAIQRNGDIDGYQGV